MENEKIFFECDDIKITSTRLVVREETYALASIVSFRKEASEIAQTSKGLSKGMWLFLCIFGIFATLFLALPLLLSAFLVGNFGVDVVGVLLLTISGTLAYYSGLRFKKYEQKHKPKYRYKIVLSVASGEVAVYETFDEQLAYGIESGLTKAVIHRG